jgi:phosphoglycerate dehydrogenase-like enzyme
MNVRNLCKAALGGERMIKIKVLEPIGKDEKLWVQEFKEKGVNIEYQDTRSWKEDDLIHYVQDAAVLVIANRTLSSKVIESISSLKLIITAFTGMDHIDLAACKRRSIQVKNTPGYATHAVAELTLGLAIMLSRNLVLASQSLTKVKSFPLGQEIYGKKVGIIGGGLIGQEVGRLFLAFGAQVSFYHYKKLDDVSLKQVELDDLLRESDFISLHIPLNEETKHFLNSNRLSLLKKTAFLINTGRGLLIDEEALLTFLKEGKIAGAALDVLSYEPPLPITHPFLDLSNVIITPHIGYRTEEAALCKADLALNHLKRWILQVES